MHLRGIQAITFDVGGTLIEPWPSVGHVYAQVAAEQGINGLLPEVLNGRFRSAWRALGERAESREDWLAVVRKVFDGMDQVRNVDVLFEALYARFTEPRVWQVFADVVPVLEQLQGQGMRLAVLSNWDERLRPLMGKLGLETFFECMIISCEVGSRKPEPEIYRRAAAALRVPTAAVLHIGDNLEHDVEGAVRAGLSGLFIQRGRPKSKSSISSLFELPKTSRGF